jgi:hypothetical protein
MTHAKERVMRRTALATCFTAMLSLSIVIPAMGTEPTGETESDQAAADESSEPQRSPLLEATGGKKRSASDKVFTNDDLEKLSGGGSETRKASPRKSSRGDGESVAAPKADDALEQMFAKEARRKEHREKIVQAEARVVEAKQRVVDLEKRGLAIKNPLLPRPSAPEEGAEAWQAGDARQRVDQTTSRLEAAREQVSQAESDLAALRNSRP